MSPAEFDSLAARVTELESLMLHLQRDAAALSDVLHAQQQQLERLRRLLARFDNRLGSLEEAEPPRDPEQEIPPHY